MSEAADTLRLLISRIERLDDEAAAIRDDRRDVLCEAETNGFDKKALREVIRRRRMAGRDRADLDGLVEVYESALGGVPRGMIDGGDLSPGLGAQAALPAPDAPLSKKQLALAEQLAWARGDIGGTRIERVIGR